PALFHAAAAIARTKRVVSAVGNSVIWNLRPASSAVQRLPDALVGGHRISIQAVALHIDYPHIHLVASRHHGELAAINQATNRVRTRRTVRGRKTCTRLRGQRCE